MGGEELFEVKGASAMEALVGQKGNLNSILYLLGIPMRSALQ